jgi:hypothetical protein
VEAIAAHGTMGLTSDPHKVSPSDPGGVSYTSPPQEACAPTHQMTKEAGSIARVARTQARRASRHRPTPSLSGVVARNVSAGKPQNLRAAAPAGVAYDVAGDSTRASNAPSSAGTFSRRKWRRGRWEASTLLKRLTSLCWCERPTVGVTNVPLFAGSNGSSRRGDQLLGEIALASTALAEIGVGAGDASLRDLLRSRRTRDTQGH